VLICCDRGDDRSVAVAVAALLALFEAPAMRLLDPGPPSASSRQGISKEDVRLRIALLSGDYPAARVPRAMVKELNNFFVSSSGGWQHLELT
jgi:hypothetical protein